MRKSDLLRLAEVRDAYRLIGDCRDLGSEPALWQIRMFEGLCQLVGVPWASGGEGFWARPPGSIQPLSFLAFGLDDRHRERYLAYAREVGPQGDPLYHALQTLPGQILTRSRSALLSDAIWYRSSVFNNYYKPARADHALFSVYLAPQRHGASVICLSRGLGERDFLPGEVRLLEFFHAELGRLIGHQLVSATEPTIDELSPRLRQTLACLLEGDSEKQVAARLGLSPTTVHQYVTALYRRFGVQSRAQLLMHMLRRSRTPE
jgi:Response regulator containing a CheY-like receiver domain and an HTH DNA-binding domain